MCNEEDYKGYSFSAVRKEMIARELKSWHKQYLPVRQNGTVLDIGAGEGETMVFYLLHGAKRIICIEADPKKAKLLAANAKIAEKRFHSRIDVVSARLDNIKLDIDGGEENMVMEQHFPGYWKTIGWSAGMPPATKVMRLTKIKSIDKLLRKKELFVIKLTQSRKVYEKERLKEGRT